MTTLSCISRANLADRKGSRTIQFLRWSNFLWSASGDRRNLERNQIKFNWNINWRVLPPSQASRENSPPAQYWSSVTSTFFVANLFRHTAWSKIGSRSFCLTGLILAWRVLPNPTTKAESPVLKSANLAVGRQTGRTTPEKSRQWNRIKFCLP